MKKHKEVLAEEKNVKEFFGIGADLKKVCFIRHQSVTKDSPQAEGETSIQFVDDILTTEKLKRKLIDKFQNHKDFLKDDFYTDQQNFYELCKRFNTMITIGLFKNIITEKFIGKNARALDHIDLRIENENGKKIIVFGKTYPSNFFSKKRHEESIDYALFAKINFTESNTSKTLIVCGGCEPYGTKQIGTYINKNFEKMLDNQEKEDLVTNYQASEFISVYKIPNHYPKDSEPEIVFHYFK